MNLISRTISAAFLILLGLSLGYYSFSMEEGPTWILFIYSLIILILGIFLLFNKKEDEIEQIKTNNFKLKSFRKVRKK